MARSKNSCILVGFLLLLPWALPALASSGDSAEWIVEPLPQNFSTPEPSSEELALAPDCYWSTGFHRRGFDNAAYDSVVFDDGSGPALYVSGPFRAVDGLVVNQVAKWDGVGWHALGTGLNGAARALLVFDDGSGPALYVGGNFSTAGGVTAYHIARWNGQSWSPVGAGFNGQVLSLAIFNDGGGPALYAGGSFGASGTTFIGYVAKWNGSVWSALGGAGNGVNASVWALESVQLGGTTALYLGGDFTLAGGQPASRIAKWNGANFSPLGTGVDNGVRSIVGHNDGTGMALYVAGSFAAAGPLAVNNIARWNGSTWSAVGSGLINGGVANWKIYDDGSGPALLALGWFNIPGTTGNIGVAKWDGASWSPWLSATLQPNGWVYEFTLFDEGTGPVPFLVGSFSAVGPNGTVASRGIARWKSSTWSSVVGNQEGNGFNGSVSALLTFNDGSGPALYAGGSFDKAGSVDATRIARWNGTAWSAVGGGIRPDWWTVVHTLATFNDGSGPALYAGGTFASAGGVDVSHVARWNGSTWAKVGTGLNGTVWNLKVLNDGSGPALYAAGSFSFTGQGGVAKWNGSSWSFIGSGMNGTVRAIEVFDSGNGPKLYAGGHFTEADGRPAKYVAVWDGNVWQPLPKEPNNIVYWLETIDDGSGPRLWASGEFTQAGDQAVNRLAKWDGSAWSSVDGGYGTNNWLITSTEFDDGGGSALYVGGAFSNISGVSVNYIAKRIPAGWSVVDKGTNGAIYTLATYDSGSGPSLYAGGAFSWAGDAPSFNFARYSCNTAPSSTDLLVSKTDGVTSTTRGAPLTYTITVSNVGAASDPAATLIDTLPAQLTGCTFTSTASGGASGNTAAGSGNLNEQLVLPPGGSVTYSVRCTVSNTASGTITNTALVNASVFDTNPGNNNATDVDTVTVNPPAGPVIQIPTPIYATTGASVLVPVVLTSSVNLGGVAFSIDYDQNCLDPDTDDNGLDEVLFAVPAAFVTSASLNAADTDGEIDITIADISPPVSALTNGVIVQIRFKVICPVTNQTINVPVLFSTAPSPTFSDTQGNNVPGTGIGGAVQILAGTRGDCNNDGSVSVADLVAVGYEIFDGDGDFWLNAPNPTYPGSPVGCDANASTLIQAADVICTQLLIFGGSCGSQLAEAGGSAPLLEVTTSFDGSLIWFRGRLAKNGSGVASLAFSLDLDPTLLDLSQIDADLDGAPDHVRFPQGQPGLAFVSSSLGDTAGEIDVLLTELSGQPLKDGVLVEIGLPSAQAAGHGFRYSENPAPSFGSLTGGDLPGISVLGTLLFLDGFESGDLSGWDLVVP